MAVLKYKKNGQVIPVIGGDMFKNEFDPNGDVLEAGGIPAFVGSALGLSVVNGMLCITFTEV